MNDINRRNAETVFQTLREVDAMVRGLVVRLDSLAGTLIDLHARTAALEAEEMKRRIAAMGRGPTER